MDELLKIFCMQESDDVFSLEDTGEGTLFLSVTEDEVERCVEIDVDAATRLRDALSRWIDE